MKIILMQDVTNLGEEGDICEVKGGYARNYLLPRKYALLYDVQSLSIIEGKKAVIQQKKNKKKEESKSLADKINNNELILKVRASGSGRIHGSVTATNILEGLTKQGIELEKKNIILPQRYIRQVGTYKVQVRLYDEMTASFMLKLISEELASKQAEAALTETDSSRVSSQEESSSPGEATAAEETADESESSQ